MMLTTGKGTYKARRMAPFVASLDKLAAVQEGMDRKHARDRGQEDK
jgi:hypothetical protein